MILDQLQQLRRYASLHPLIATAAEFAAGTSLLALPLGKHEIDGQRLYVARDSSTGKTQGGSRLEAHRKYIDIQIALDRPDVIGYRPTALCRQVSQSYDAAKDIEFFADRVDTWLTVAPGSFAIFFPTDAHAPLAIEGNVEKVIFKLAVE